LDLEFLKEQPVIFWVSLSNKELVALDNKILENNHIEEGD